MNPSERLKGIDVFVQVIQGGSFAAAAERLNLSPSAVSKGVTRLEQRLGVQLLRRTTRRLALTDEGTAFYHTCIAVLGELEQAEVNMRQQAQAPAGRVRIDLPASFGRLHVVPLILEVAARYPAMQVDISFSDRFIDPVQEEVDLLVRVGGPDAWPAAVGHLYLGAQRQVFCASPGYLAAQGSPRSAADLAQHRCICFRQADGHTSPWLFRGEQVGDVERSAMRASVVLGDGEAQVAAALAGHGIAQLPLWLVNPHLAAGTLCLVLPGMAVDGLPINLAWLKRREHLPKVQVLLEHLGKHLKVHGGG